MQNDGPIGRTNVRELPVIWLGHRDRANLRPSPGGFSHPVKVDVGLVSSGLSGVRNDFGFRIGTRGITPASNEFFTAGRCSWLRQLTQRFFQFGESVDFRHGTVQQLHCGSDMPEEMFVTLNQPEKSVSTERLHKALHGAEL